MANAGNVIETRFFCSQEMDIFLVEFSKYDVKPVGAAHCTLVFYSNRHSFNVFLKKDDHTDFQQAAITRRSKIFEPSIFFSRAIEKWTL